MTTDTNNPETATRSHFADGPPSLPRRPGLTPDCPPIACSAPPLAPEDYARICFNAYGDTPGAAGPWFTFDGREMPRWETLKDSERDLLTRARWQAGATAVLKAAGVDKLEARVAKLEAELDASRLLSTSLWTPLSAYAGELGDSEGAKETLDRLLAELQRYRSAEVQGWPDAATRAASASAVGADQEAAELREVRRVYKLKADRPAQMAAELANRGETRGWENAVKCAEGAELGFQHPANVVHLVAKVRSLGERGRLTHRELLLEGVLTLAMRAIEHAKQTVEVPSLFPEGHPRAGQPLAWHYWASRAQEAVQNIGAVRVVDGERPTSERVAAVVHCYEPDAKPEQVKLVRDLVAALLGEDKGEAHRPSAGYLLQLATERVSLPGLPVLVVRLSREEDGRCMAAIGAVAGLHGYGPTFGDAVEASLDRAMELHPVEVPDALRYFVTSRAMAIQQAATVDMEAPQVVTEQVEGGHRAVLKVGGVEFSATGATEEEATRNALAVAGHVYGGPTVPSDDSPAMAAVSLDAVLAEGAKLALERGNKNLLLGITTARDALPKAIQLRRTALERWEAVTSVAMGLGLLMRVAAAYGRLDLASAAALASSGIPTISAGLIHDSPETVAVVLLQAGRSCPVSTSREWDDAQREVAMEWALTVLSGGTMAPPAHVDALHPVMTALKAGA